MILSLVVIASVLFVSYALVDKHSCKIIFKRNALHMTNDIKPISSQDSMKSSVLKSFGYSIAATSMFFGLNMVCNAQYEMSDEDKTFQFNQKPAQTDIAVINTGNQPNYVNVRKDLAEMITAKPDKGPTFVRLAWHSSGTYDKMTKTGGSSKGTIRFKEELEHGSNKGLDIAIQWLEPIYKKYNMNTDLSYADLYTLVGVVAIETLGKQ